ACHLAGTANQTSALADAIPFATLAADPDFDGSQLAIALYNPHPAMPKFNVTREEVRALGAYIRGLNPIPDRQRTDGDIDKGRAIAGSMCGACHAIAGDGPGNNAQAPPFATFAERWPIDNLAEALAEGIVVSHSNETMPELSLDPADIEALLVYIASVQR
ncbi:MAG: c-type cytochrome, partial [Alphaproteobacteria bacterium]